MSVATLSEELAQFSLDLDDFEPKPSVEAITSTKQKTPYAEITEQPFSKKFRYPTEPRSAGPIVGVNTTSERKTYPTIKIHNYIGEVRIIVSCVTKDEPYRPHPHRILDRSKSKTDLYIASAKITTDCNEHQFKNLGIQCVKKLNVVEALREKQAVDLDPFKTGYDHINTYQNIDLKAVRLCFQVFIPREAPALPVPLTPVVSDILYSDKASVDLTIVRASHCSGPVEGGTQVILLCEKVTKDDTVVFYLEENNEVVWEATANTVSIHKQAAIVIETPAFMDPLTDDDVIVHFQLRRIKDKIRGNSLSFNYIPKYTAVENKRKKVESILQLYNKGKCNGNMSLPEQQQIKWEPDETSMPLLADPWSIAESNQADPVMSGPISYSFSQNAIVEQSYIQPSGDPNVHQIAQPRQIKKTLRKELLQATANIKPNAKAQPKTLDIHPPLQTQSSNLELLTANMQTLPPDMQLLSSDMQLSSANVQPLYLNMQESPPNLQPMSPKPYTQSVAANMQSDCSIVDSLFTNTQIMTYGNRLLSRDMQPIFSNMQLPSCKIEDIPPLDLQQMSPNLQHDWGLMAIHMSPPEQQVHQSIYQEVDMDTISSSSLSKLAQDSNDELMLNSKEFEFCSLLSDTNNINENLLVQL